MSTLSAFPAMSLLRRRERQHGLALLLLMALVMAGVAFLTVALVKRVDVAAARNRANARILAEAKDALIGWSLSQSSPGNMPCPDTAAPGSPTSGTAPPSCNLTTSMIGRLPWKTLGIQEPKDASGETLWYALDYSYRPGVTPGGPYLSVYASDGVSLLTSEAVVVVFAPGAIVSATQSRGTGQQTNAANYLDKAGPPTIVISRDNSSTAGPFIQGPVKDTTGNQIVNDSLAYVSATALSNLVAKLP